MTTPEGRVKKAISKVLDNFPSVYSFMPVQFGMGASGVDYHCVVGMLVQFPGGLVDMVPVAFFIEAKKPGGEPTVRQDTFLKERHEKQNCACFVIDEDPSINKGKGLDILVEWLAKIESNNERLRALYNPTGNGYP
jgi:hypothetical protein